MRFDNRLFDANGGSIDRTNTFSVDPSPGSRNMITSEVSLAKTPTRPDATRLGMMVKIELNGFWFLFSADFRARFINIMGL